MAKELTALALLLLATAGEAQAQQRSFTREEQAVTGPARALIGAWDLELTGGPRKCTIVLAAEPAARGRKLRFPAICRRGLPVVAEIVAWSLTPDGLPRLDTESGAPVLTFARVATGLEAKAAGALYRLAPKSYPRLAPLREPSAAERAALAPRAVTVVDPARAPAIETVPGRYMVMRQAGREACRLVLSGPQPPAEAGTAAFEGRCDDTGLAIFAPAGWRYGAGRLSLIARKGHSVELVFEAGQWRRDPAVGAPLMLRKLP